MDDQKISVTLYRHKTEKDLFLCRNRDMYGFPRSDEIFKVSVHFMDSIISVKSTEIAGENFDVLMEHYGKKLEFDRIRLVNVDGYIGECRKTVYLNVKDFEKVVLTEV